jgi:hypothetical protein
LTPHRDGGDRNARSPAGSRRRRARAADATRARARWRVRFVCSLARSRYLRAELPRFKDWYLPYFDRDRTIATAYDRIARALDLDDEPLATTRGAEDSSVTSAEPPRPPASALA